MSSALVFIFVLGVLIIVHEFGHFLAAKWVGIRVERFSIGFGPALFGRKWGGTDFVVSLLPLGGFVKMAGEGPGESQGQPWEFQSKSLGEKFFVVFAGPLMNALLAFLIFSAIFLVGQPTLSTRIGKVMAGTPAEAAGIHSGDRIVAVNAVPVADWEALLKEVHRERGEIVFTLERGARRMDLAIQPQSVEVPRFFGRKKKVSFVGVAPSSELHYVRSSLFQALGLGARRVWDLTGLILYSLGLMITGAISFQESVTGPIGIYFMTQQAAQMGVLYLFYFMGTLSVSLFVLNLLPIPVLDGGHVLFILIERLRGSPLRESVKERMTQGGLALLLVLMAFVILQDLSRFSVFENLLRMFKKV